MNCHTAIRKKDSLSDAESMAPVVIGVSMSITTSLHNFLNTMFERITYTYKLAHNIIQERFC